MENVGWRYYNGALLPSNPPHVQINTDAIDRKQFWNCVCVGGGKKPLLARWTSNWDCKQETNWWYVIKDEPFNINLLKAKRRYEINKGNKNFEIYEINPVEYKKQIYRIQEAAYSKYPEKYRPTVNRENLFEEIDKWTFYKFYGAFNIESKQLAGYALLNRKENYISYAVQKVMPQYESLAINAALVNKVLIDHKEFLENDGYICDGARNILHETRFQDYLEKYFGFRKAYCKLHVQYRPIIKFLVNILFPFRKYLYNLDNYSFIHKINGIMKMEEIVRS